MEHIIYLHGFLSSPKSEKALLVSNYISTNHPKVKLHMPTLSGDSATAIETISNIVTQFIANKETPINTLRFIGSSMGGFLATYFVQSFGGKAALINPAVEPFNLVADYFGSHENPYTGEVFQINCSSVEHLRHINLKVTANDPNYYVLLQTGDETLDYRLAESKYGKQRCLIEEGGNHSFMHLENHLEEVMKFLLKG